MGSSAGEIVQVQGGHIIRATGRKDRHSKVYTAKGPRDRRVRLSAHTAIQFYDVQDRLGYDRPSKAVDWLMKKAKSAIDKLAELPPFDPVAANAATSTAAASVEMGPPGLGCASDEINPFHAAGFHHGYPHQDLCLSLQSFQNPGLVHGGSDPGHPNSDPALFGFEAGSSSGGGGGGHWAAPVAEPNNLGEMGQFSRLLAWSGGGGYGGGERSFQGQGSSIRAWDDLPMDHHRIPKAEMQGGMQQHHHHQQSTTSSMAGIGVLGSDGFMGYCLPASAAQMHGGGGGGGEDQDVHGITVAYHHNNSVSSMSTDSSR